MMTPTEYETIYTQTHQAARLQIRDSTKSGLDHGLRETRSGSVRSPARTWRARNSDYGEFMEEERVAALGQVALDNRHLSAR